MKPGMLARTLQARLAASPGEGWRRLLTRRSLLARLGVYGGGGLTGLYTWQVEPHWLEITQRRLPIAYLPPSLQGSRLAQLSDLHLGRRVDDGYLLGVCERVSRLQPEFVVYTGDLTDLSPEEMDHARAMIPRLSRGQAGTVAILGNHDYGPDWSHPEMADQVAELARAAGMVVLRNQVAEIRGLHFAGLDDLWAGRFRPQDALPRLPRDAATLVLSHNPDTADRGQWENYQGWILAGHTHGGQCKPPFLPPPLLPVRNRRYTAGEFALAGGRKMYISRGVGHTLQVRFNVRPEVTVFELTDAGGAAA